MNILEVLKNFELLKFFEFLKFLKIFENFENFVIFENFGIYETKWFFFQKISSVVKPCMKFANKVNERKS